MVRKTTVPPTGTGYWFEEHSLFVRYLIVRHTHHRMHVLTSTMENQTVLPVFSTGKTARDYLRSSTFGTGWHVRESTAGELVSLLMGHIADVETIALDPRHEPTVGEDGPTDLLSKKSFIGSLMEEPMLTSPR